MYIIATTRFNSETWRENCTWRDRNEWEGCAYGTPTRAADKLTPNAMLFVLEMHNDCNKVKGVGLVKNAIVIGQYHKIYKTGNYNRYTYKSQYRVDRSDLDKEEEKIFKIFDVLLFKGSRHMKRGQGLTAVPDWMAKNKHIDFIKFFRNLFLQRYRAAQIAVPTSPALDAASALEVS
jgi:hypothetical protein